MYANVGFRYNPSGWAVRQDLLQYSPFLSTLLCRRLARGAAALTASQYFLTSVGALVKFPSGFRYRAQ